MPTIDERLDSILEELHNSWLEDDYEYDDPNGVEAKQAIKSLIISECERAEKKGYKKGVIDLAKARKSAEDRSS